MAWWAQKTKTGRVVYDSPKNPFRWSDVRRILRSLEMPSPADEVSYGAFLQVLGSAAAFLASSDVLDDFKVTFNQEEVSLPELGQASELLLRQAFQGFGGGGFGGAGASRDFNEGTDSDERSWLEKILKPFPTP